MKVDASPSGPYYEISSKEISYYFPCSLIIIKVRWPLQAVQIIFLVFLLLGVLYMSSDIELISKTVEQCFLHHQ